MTTIVCSIRLGGSMSYPLSGPMLHQIGIVDSLWFSVPWYVHRERVFAMEIQMVRLSTLHIFIFIMILIDITYMIFV